MAEIPMVLIFTILRTTNYPLGIPDCSQLKRPSTQFRWAKCDPLTQVVTAPCASVPWLFMESFQRGKRSGEACEAVVAATYQAPGPSGELFEASSRRTGA